MANYFFAAAAHGGSDSNAGTIGSPFLTLTHGQTVAVDGDVFNLNGGDTFAPASQFTANVSLQSYGTGQAILTVAGGANTLSYLNPDNVTVENIAVNNGDTTNTFCPIFFEWNDQGVHSGITTNLCTITGGILGVRHKVDTVTGFVHGGRVTNNTISGCSDQAVNVTAPVTTRSTYSDWQINGNPIFNINGFTQANSSGVGIVLNGACGLVDKNYIAYNHIFNIGSTAVDTSGAGGPAGFFAFFSDSVIGHHNVVHDVFCAAGSTRSNKDGLGLDIDEANTNCQIF